MVNNTQVGGHLHGFVIDLENSLGYSIKFIHDSRDGWRGRRRNMRCGLDKSFKGDAPCGNALEAFRTNVVAHNARLRYSSFEGNLIIPALLMLLFCTILRRNYPARLNGQGLKSQATFSIFLFSFFIFVFPFSSLSSFFSFLFFFDLSQPCSSRYYDFNFTERFLSFPLAFGALERAPPFNRRRRG